MSQEITMIETTNPPVTPAPTPAARTGVPGWVLLLVGVAALVVATAALTATLVGGGWNGPGSMMRAGNGTPGYGPGMMGGYGYGYGNGGMMGGYGPGGVDAGLQPGDQGFVPGTTDSPRAISVIAGPGYRFTPSTIVVQRGETVMFVVTTMGPLVHEFMVGPADAVAADEEGTPEVADIGMMQTKSVTYTFDGSGPYAFACHADGHYEAGMAGTITLVG